MNRVAQYLKQVREERGGIIGRVIFLTAAIIALCAYFGFDLRGFLASPRVQETIRAVWEFIRTLGGTF
jgi:hypothetical protein